jgi:hypothetical protein
VLQKYGVTPEQVLAFLGVQGEEDITLDHLATFFGITTALKDGDTMPEQAFGIGTDGKASAPSAEKPLPVCSDESFARKKDGWRKAVEGGNTYAVMDADGAFVKHPESQTHTVARL